MSIHPSRLGAASGIVYVLAILILNSSGSSSNLVLGAQVLALVLFVPFLANLWVLLRETDPAGGWLAATVFGAGLTATGVKLAGVLPEILVDQGDLTPAIAEAFTRFANLSFMISMTPLGIALAAVAAIVVRSKVLPVWLGWFAAIVSPLLVVNGFDLGNEFGPAFILFLVWTLTTAIVLLSRAVTARNPVAAATPAAAGLR